MSRIARARYHFAEARDVGTLVTARPLDLPQTMPDTLLAWQAKLPAHRHDTLVLVQVLTARLRDHRSGCATADDLSSPATNPGDPVLAARVGAVVGVVG